MAIFLKRLRSLKHSRPLLIGLALTLLLGAGGAAYAFHLRQAAAGTGEPALQTATAQQGDLVVSASGTGILTAVEEIELEFKSSGQVTGVYIKPGDLVKEGTLLAEIDNENARIKYEQARQTYLELTSDAAIAAAQEQLAQAHVDLKSAFLELEYLISPDVLYWELEIAEARQAREKAMLAIETNPSDEEAQSDLQKIEAYLDFAEDSLEDAWERYYEEYVPETFSIVKEIGEKDIYNTPTDLHILLARTAIEEAQKQLEESEEYYNVLMGEPMPENASSNALIALQDARRNLEDAQADLDGTKIFAPITGTILSVDLVTGHMVDNDRDTDAVTGTVIVMADLSKPVLEIYLDETDWELVAIGSPVEIVFDTLLDKTFTGKVSQIDEELYQSDNASVIKGVVQLDSGMDEINLPIGSSAIVDVIYARVEDAVLIPVEALHEISAGDYAVYVVENNEPTLRTVEVGLQGQVYVEVKSGLEAGDVVATDMAAE
ncbi:MAG: efflux RND transporter periplasmic adaptor subunit [Chloroflexota bacterium]